MIADADVVRLAPGVTVGEGRLADVVRGDSWPLNGTGMFVLADAGRPIGATARELARAFSLPPDRARADVLQFVWMLNGLALVNVDRGGSRLRQLVSWIQLAARLAPAGAVPATLVRRRRIDTGSVPRAVATCLASILPRAAIVAAITTAVTAQLALVTDASGLAVPLAVGIGTGAGLGLHEAAHAALLRGVPSALVTRGRRTYVLHSALPPRRRSLVAVGGPLAVAVVGLVCLVASAFAAQPAVALAGCPLVGHALALTVLGGDGRVACGL